MVDKVISEGEVHLLSVQQVAKRMSMSNRTLWRMVANGRFPQPIRYSRKLVRWKSTDVDLYILALTSENARDQVVCEDRQL